MLKKLQTHCELSKNKFLFDMAGQALGKVGKINDAIYFLEKSSNLTVDQGLEYAKLWSTSFLVSADLREGVMAFLEKRDPKFNE